MKEIMENLKELNRLARNIRRIRKIQAMNQVELAYKAGTRPATISDIESGTNKNPGWELLSRICKALQTNIHQLTMPDATSALINTNQALPSGLQKLLDDQDKLLAPVEDRISLDELNWLRKIPLLKMDQLSADFYLQILRHLRLLVGSLIQID